MAAALGRWKFRTFPEFEPRAREGGEDVHESLWERLTGMRPFSFER